MHLSAYANQLGPRLSRRLAARTLAYTCTALLCMGILWALGYESVYGTLTPLYAHWAPAFNTALTPLATMLCAAVTVLLLRGRLAAPGFWAASVLVLLGIACIALASSLFYQQAWQANQSWAGLFQLVAGGTARYAPAALAPAGALWLWHRALDRTPWPDRPWSHPRTRRWLRAAAASLLVLGLSFYLMRRGWPRPEGWAAAWPTYPGGPFCFAVPPGGGLAPTPQRFAVVAGGFLAGALAVFPLYAWARRLTDESTALITAVFYTVMPGVLLNLGNSTQHYAAPLVAWGWHASEQSLARRSPGWGMACGALLLAAAAVHPPAGAAAMYPLLRCFLGPVPGNTATSWSARWKLRGRAWLFVYYLAGLLAAAICLRFLAPQSWTEAHLRQILTTIESLPRSSRAVWLALAPAAWAWWAGIPAAWLAWQGLRRQGWPAGLRPLVGAALVVFVVLFDYRAAAGHAGYHVYALLALAAALTLGQLCAASRTQTPLVAAAGLQLALCWFCQAYLAAGPAP